MTGALCLAKIRYIFFENIVNRKKSQFHTRIKKIMYRTGLPLHTCSQGFSQDVNSSGTKSLEMFKI